MSDETEEANKANLPGEFTNRHRRHVWERHTSGAYIVDLMMLCAESTALSAAGALVLAFPIYARKAKFRRSVPEAADRLFTYLEGRGWTAPEILDAGTHALTWLRENHMPVTSGSDEVKEAQGFFDAGQPEDMPGE